MKTNKIRKLSLAILSFVLFVSLIFASAFALTSKTANVVAEDVEKVWNISQAQSSAWRHATARKLGVDIYRSAADQTAEPLTNNNTGMLSLVNDATKVTYTRGGISENPVLVCGNNAYVAYCFKGDTIGAEDTEPLTGDLFTIEEGFVFKYNASDANRYYGVKVQFQYNGSSWVFIREEKVWNVSGVQSSIWRNIDASNRKLGVDIYRSAADRTAEPLTDNNTAMLSLVNDATKVTYTRDGKTENPSIIIGCNAYVAYCFKGDVIGATDIEPRNGDLFTIEEGFLFRYYNTVVDYNRYYNVKVQYEYNGSAWVYVREEKVWNVSGVQSSIWRNIDASNRKLGVDIYRSAADRTAEPLTDNNTAMLSLVNDATKVTYTRDGKTENPSIIIGCNAYVAYCFKGDVIGATDIEPRNGDLFTIETGFKFRYYNTAFDYNRYYSVKLQYEYFNGTWKTCSYSGTGIWANSSVDPTKSDYSSNTNGIGIRTYGTDKTITATQTDGIQLTVFDLTKITFYRQGATYHPTRIIGATYTMHYLFSGIPNDSFVSGDMLRIEEGFSFIYNNLRYTYDEAELYVFTGRSWQVPSLSGSVTQMNVSLNENINAVFTFKLPTDNVDNGINRIYVTVSGEESVINVNTLTEKDRNEDWVTFEVAIKLNPTLLTADIQFYFLSYIDGTNYFSKVFHKNVKEYCDYFIQNGTAEQVEMVKALLNYGGYSQTFFEVNTDNLANDGLYDDDNPIDSVVVEDALVQSATTASGLTFKSMQLYLETTPTMRFYFTLDDGSLIENYSFKLRTDNAYNLIPDYDETAKKYYVDVADIPAKYIGTRFTVEVKNKIDNSVYTIASSVNCYIKIALDNSDNTTEKKNMLKALYVYGNCANAFAN